MDFIQEYSPDEAVRIDGEFSRLAGKHYMDHAGATLYAESQIRSIQNQLTSNLFCNPHTSHLTGDLIDSVRHRVLQFFNTRSSEYTLIFTSGATASLRMVAECFTFRPENAPEGDDGVFVYLRDNHTSVLGMRAIVATDRIEPMERVDFLRHTKLSAMSSQRKPSLFVFPAQNNFNAAKYPLELIEEIQRNGLRGYDDEKFYVCLDAASYVSTNFLDLNRYRPDFVCLSFYKIFGYPTGLGALLIRNGSETVLNKKYYGGGTIKILLSGQNLHMKHDSVEQRFEDGTQPFLSIIALLEGINTIERLIPAVDGQRSMERVSKHVFNLAKYCYRKLGSLKHANGLKAIRFYMDSEFSSGQHQGGIVNFNVLREDGSYVGFAEFAQVAERAGIYVRTGCFCNAGTCQRQLGLSDEDVLMFFRMGKICGDDTDMIEGMPTGTVRVSFGYMNSSKDVDVLAEMIAKSFIRRSSIHSNSGINQSGNPILESIYIYPIRSCGAFRVPHSWPLCGKGLRFDREFTIVDSCNIPLSGTKHSEMASIVPKIGNNVLLLTHSSQSDFILNLNEIEGPLVQLNGSAAVDCGDLVASWISRTLRTSRLRLLKQTTVGNSQQKLLMINRNVLRCLGDELNEIRLVEHLRGNLVIDVPAQFDMQAWKELTIGNERFQIIGMCTRCPMIHVNQADSLKAIASVFTKKIPLGIYLIYMESENSTANQLKCGAELEVATRRDIISKSMVITESTTRYDFRGVSALGASKYSSNGIYRSSMK
ncbi:molybdenum cofactor sulfurase 1-like [Topomyia yanbarensis]|uniref:molybdenum cofactor sulfurase 1-like n=1 Tax=Topomyia yanbarensis TaxID=2498891 RepID=UPI00273A83EB|nr:molybdenum cofactor sulfurase 1-like [Topomyia yanbarensis]